MGRLRRVMLATHLMQHAGRTYPNELTVNISARSNILQKMLYTKSIHMQCRFDSRWNFVFAQHNVSFERSTPVAQRKARRDGNVDNICMIFAACIIGALAAGGCASGSSSDARPSLAPCAGRSATRRGARRQSTGEAIAAGLGGCGRCGQGRKATWQPQGQIAEGLQEGRPGELDLPQIPARRPQAGC